MLQLQSPGGFASLLLAILCAGCGGGDSRALPSESLDLADQLQSCKAGDSREIVHRGTVSLRELEAVAAVEHLEKLELYDLPLPADVVAPLVGRLQHLTHLRLEGGEIDDRTLLAISELPQLEVLNLPDGTFGDAAISAIARMPKLQLLRFHSPNVSDRGLAALAESPALRFLHLMDVPITDSGLAALQGMDQLESLYVDGGDVTDTGIASLLKSNPQLHFHRNQLHVDGDPNADGH